MAKNLLIATFGNKVQIDFGEVVAKQPTFVAGGNHRFLIDEEYDGIGVVLVNGEVKFADGTHAYALLEIDESSSGEHCGTGIFLRDGNIAWQNQPDFCEAIGKKPDEIFPYRYKYTGPVRSSDHHVGDDGWSF